MNFSKKKILFLIIFLLSALTGRAEPDLEYKQITNAFGLSNSAINCILQDSRNIMWFGTWDGLNSYDSKNFKIYMPEPGNLQAISNNIIRDIIEEKEGIS